MDFKRSYPKLADYLSNRVDFSRKEQQQSRWHWFTLILFGLMTVATLSQKLILLTLFIAIVALIKGPVMILWGMLYSFLVGLFPPIGILLSAIFFLLNIGTFTKNWRMTLVGIYFYFYPFGVMALSEVMHWDNHWFIAGSLLFRVDLVTRDVDKALSTLWYRTYDFLVCLFDPICTAYCSLTKPFEDKNKRLP